jgi:hypothetical protein
VASRFGEAGSNKRMLDLPSGITTCLFDLDGVPTQTAKIHAQAWKPVQDTVHALGTRKNNLVLERR